MRRYWITKEKKKILISRMEIDHLRNTKAMLERRAVIELGHKICDAYGFLGTLNGEMAQYTMEGEIWHLERMSKKDFARGNFPEYEAICYWLDKRESQSQ